MLFSKPVVIDRSEEIYKESKLNYENALKRVHQARQKFSVADASMFEVVCAELTNAEEALNIAVQRLKATSPDRVACLSSSAG